MKNFRVSVRMHPKFFFSSSASRKKKQRSASRREHESELIHTPKRERERERLFNDDNDEYESGVFFFSDVFSLVVFSERGAR